jgi:hypothetical protein
LRQLCTMLSSLGLVSCAEGRARAAFIQRSSLQSQPKNA